MKEQPKNYKKLYYSLNLKERTSLLKTLDPASLLQIDSKKATQKLKRWRTQAPLTDDEYFDLRLATENLNLEQFNQILGEPDILIEKFVAEIPEWIVNNESLYQETSFSWSSDVSRIIKSDTLSINGFLTIIGPLLSEKILTLQKELLKIFKSLPYTVPFEPDIFIQKMYKNLHNYLIEMLSRTLVLEMHVFLLTENLQGDPSKEGFDKFIESLHSPDTVSRIFDEYPVLFRQVATSIKQWHDFAIEFYSHLCTDWLKIMETFSITDDIGQIVKIQSTGDRHQDGRSVLITQFESGCRLVYKPRSLSIDIHFQELLQWLNSRGDHPPFYITKILNRKTYGWTEFITHIECKSQQEISEFYETLGGLIAILYAIQGGDFHSENLIAFGKHPVLVDLETLFHSYMELDRDIPVDKFMDGQLASSVISTGILPDHFWDVSRTDDIDLSGLGTSEGKVPSQLTPYWENSGTDQMHLQFQNYQMPKDNNQPVTNAEFNILSYQDSIIAGFTNIYWFLYHHQDELLSNEGPLASFRDDKIRFIPRNTETYSLLLRESFHPDLMRNALDRDRFFDKLWMAIQYRSSLSKLITSESCDLWTNNIPIFMTMPSSTHLWDSRNVCISNFFPDTGMNKAYNQIRRMGTKDLQQQIWLIQASLATLGQQNHSSNLKQRHNPESDIIAHSNQFLNAAKKVGDYLYSLAFRNSELTSWYGLKSLQGNKWGYLTLGTDIHDLYDDISGIIFFLAYLGKVSMDEKYTELAQSATAMILPQIDQIQEQKTNQLIGGYYGLGSIIYTLIHLSILWDDQKLLLKLVPLVQSLPDKIAQDKEWGILSGTSGCLLSLLRLYRQYPSPIVYQTALQCGEHLITNAQKTKYGVGWIPENTGNSPLSGLAYGSAGISWALLELADITQKEIFHEFACLAIQHERSLFSNDAQNWLDLREDTSAHNHTENTMVAWCHGAAGIGLARLKSYPYLQTPKVREEIEIALNATTAYGFDGNHSLCHGSLGNLDLLLQASNNFSDETLLAKTYKIASRILSDIEGQGWRCGVPIEVYTPGLMTGLAGIGYGLLRLADPERVPSVLTLEPPRQ